MTNHRYNTPELGTTDWHVPLNENFAHLDRDVEIRDVNAKRDDYEPKLGAKFLATDSGATYTGDGTSWNLIGYVVPAIAGGLGHYVNYADGVDDEAVNSFIFGSGEKLEVTRIAFPMKGVSDGTTDPDAKLRVYEGVVGEDVLVEVDGNSYTSAKSDPSSPWVAANSPVTVTVTNSTGDSIDATPKVWANYRR